MAKGIYLVAFILSVPIAQAQKTIFWQIQDTANHTTSYLLGVNHCLGASFIDTFEAVQKALLNSAIAIFEKVEDPQHLLQTISARERSDSVRWILTKKEYALLRSLMANRDEDFIHKLRPLELKIRLTQAVSMHTCGYYSPADAFILLDEHLENKAKAYNIPVMGLESSADQIMALEGIARVKGISWASEKDYIKALLKLAKKGRYNRAFCDFDRKYVHFDLPYELDKICPNAILLKERNDEWLPTLLEQLSSKNCFVAVGFDHLRYDSGLIVQLRRKGYMLQPIPLR